jgi:hypothetical protein
MEECCPALVLQNGCDSRNSVWDKRQVKKIETTFLKQ